MYQRSKAKKARAEHHQSAQAKANGERPGERHADFSGSSATTTTRETTQRPYSLREQPGGPHGRFGSNANVAAEETPQRPYSPR